MKNEMVDSIKMSSNPHGTELELDGTVEIRGFSEIFYPNNMNLEVAVPCYP